MSQKSRFLSHLCILLCLLFSGLASPCLGQGGTEEKKLIGLEYGANLVLPQKLVPRPGTRASAILLRVANVEPLPDGSWKHDVRYMAMRPGTHDLTKFLMLEDGTEPKALPPFPLTVSGLLPEGHDGKLAEVEISPWRRWFGSYRTVLQLLGVLWMLLLIPLVFWKKKTPPPLEEPPPPVEPTLADRIRPFLGPMTYQNIEPGEQAQLERLVHAYWREKLGVSEELEMPEAMVRLKAHPQAMRSLQLLESWLHFPPQRRNSSTAELLAEFSQY